MKDKLFFILGGVALFSIVFTKNVDNSTNRPVSIQAGDDSPVIVLPVNSHYITFLNGLPVLVLV